MQSLLLYLIVFLISSITILFVKTKKLEGINLKILDIKKMELSITSIKQLLFYIPVFLLPILVSGYRYFVGTDYANNMMLFENLKKANFNELIRQTNFNEPFYVFLNRIGSILFIENSVGIFFLSAIITFYFIYKTILYFKSKYDINTFLSLWIFYCSFFPLMLNIQRQMIAVSIIAYSYTKLIEKRYVSFIVYCIIATFFHSSAIIILPMILLELFRNRMKFVYVILIVSPLFTSTLITLISDIPFFSKYFYRYALEKNGLSIISLIEIAIFLIPLFVFKNEIIKKDKNINILFPISLFTIPIIFLSSYQNWFSRSVYYISILEVVLIPLIIKSQEKKDKYHLMYAGFFLYFFLYFVLKFYIVGNEEIFPYRTLNFLFE
ncbi:EpsG family protein [Enterococcus gallinarum]|uniref:EpsG family protein n=1 Tax=Enterococcus gallinarum TaxID=1353 RepID=UPI0035CA9EDC